MERSSGLRLPAWSSTARSSVRTSTGGLERTTRARTYARALVVLPASNYPLPIPLHPPLQPRRARPAKVVAEARHFVEEYVAFVAKVAGIVSNVASRSMQQKILPVRAFDATFLGAPQVAFFDGNRSRPGCGN